MIGTTLIVSPPLSGFGVSHVEPPSSMLWAGGPRREFPRESVVALGLLRQHGDFVARFVVRLTDGSEVQVIGTEQSTQERAWLHALGKIVPLSLTGRDTPWTLAWVSLRARCPIAADDFRRELFSGHPPHAPHVHGWVVRLGGRAAPAQRAWLRAHGYSYSGGTWCRADLAGARRPDSRR